MSNQNTEKITVNLNVVDLGYIDLLVEEGFYSNRTDLIKTAIRNQLNTHSTITREIVTKKSFTVGAVGLTEKELQRLLGKNEKIDLKVIGFLNINKNVSLDLMKQVVSTISVKGIIRCSEEIKEYYGL